MGSRRARRNGRLLRCGWLLPVLAACGEGTAPAADTVTFTMCDPAHWVAYQDGDGPWIVLGTGNGIHTVPITTRLGLARARFQDESSVLVVDYLTSEQAASALKCPVSDEVSSGGMGVISGSIAGLTNGRWAYVIFNGNGAFVPAGATGWQLEAHPASGLLAALRYDSVGAGGAVAARSVILRRDRSFSAGATVPLLDFDSNEAFEPHVSTISYTGPRAYANVWFLSGRGEYFLSSVPAGPLVDGDIPRTASIRSMPAVRQADGEINLLNLSTNVAGEHRVVQYYFVQGSDRTLDLGPVLATPTFTTVVSAPSRRVRVDLPSQIAYGGAMAVEMAQLTATRSTRVTLTATREYFGITPTVWSLTVPDLTGLAGMVPSGAALGAGEFSWFARANNRRFSLAGANAVDGETVLYGSRSGTEP